MKIRNIAGVLSLGVILGLSLGLAPHEADTEAAPSAQPNSFAVDSVHSSLIFKINHMGIANFYGRFNDIEGTYTLDQDNPAQNKFDFTVKADSVDTKNGRRDGHLKSADFFNVAEYPTITFKSTKVASKGENQLNVTGDLTLHGATKPITLDMTIFPAKETPQGLKGGFETTFTIKRTDFDMDTYVANGSLGDEVTITVAIEGGKK